jgi:hypothetical protein
MAAARNCQRAPCPEPGCHLAWDRAVPCMGRACMRPRGMPGSGLPTLTRLPS